MKRSLLLVFPLSMLVLFFMVFLAAEQASGTVLSASIGGNVENNADQAGPPWLVEEGWNYRRPIVITNDGGDWLHYQVLITLDNNNFDFNLANTDGSDLRFTLSEGTILIPYWIESWDSSNQNAYVWVRVPLLDHGDTTIYLYYNNPDAALASDGDATFDGFDDDWDLFKVEGYNPKDDVSTTEYTGGVKSPFNWSVISGTPDVSQDGYLILANGTGIKSTSTYQNQAIGFRANFGAGGGNEWAGFYNEDNDRRTMIGDRSVDPTNLYLRNYNTGESNSLLPRVGGSDWHGVDHTYEVRWCILNINCDVTQSTGDIDHGIRTTTLTTEVPLVALPITLHNNNSGTASTLLIDWVYVRKYSNIEPTYLVGGKQGLVELVIENIDTPDPLPAGETLTYQLTIFNTGTINATGVVVTNTLPTSVQLGEITSSQGSCVPGGIILCNLNTILANSMANITIIVTPTIDGVIMDSAVVGSPGYELEFGDNTVEQTTLVDSVPPVVNWEEPVQNGGTYIVYGRLVQLEASATDNDQVASVDFKYWDHNGGGWTPIGTDYTYPYQDQFDLGDLVPYQTYQVFVTGTDRAGNKSDPYSPLQRIYIERRLSVFLPLMIK
jgi:uncharacterized repeat protein (TIGR01451 family)